MTVVKASLVCGTFVCHRSVITGCHVLCQVNAPVGTSESGVPMLAPKVNSRLNPRKKSQYQPTPFAIANCVNTGSESMNTRRGMRAYSSRQNHDPPERLTKEIGIGAIRADGLLRGAVVRPIVVDEAPSIAETEWLQRPVNVLRAIGRIE